MPDEILKDIFNKHLPYEIDMLRDTYRMQAEAPTDVHKNALIEAFCVHARNLIDFFMCRKSGDAVATEFTTGFIRQLDDTVDPLKTIRTRMNKQIFHLTKVKTIMKADQFDLARDGTEVINQLEKEIVRFVACVRRNSASSSAKRTLPFQD